MHESLTRKEKSALVRFESWFPGTLRLVEHSACLAAAQIEGKTNVRHVCAPTIGGWGAWLAIYSPHLEGFYQRFALHGTDEYPRRFETLTAARAACEAEEPALWAQLKEEIESK